MDEGTSWRGPAGPHAPYPPAGWATRQTSTTAIIALVLAVASFVVPVIPAIIALVLARNADEEIAASGGRVTGRELVTAARVASWVSLALTAAALLLFVMVVSVFGMVVF